MRWTSSVIESPGSAATVVAVAVGIGSLLQDQARSAGRAGDSGTGVGGLGASIDG